MLSFILSNYKINLNPFDVKFNKSKCEEWIYGYNQVITNCKNFIRICKQKNLNVIESNIINIPLKSKSQQKHLLEMQNNFIWNWFTLVKNPLVHAGQKPIWAWHSNDNFQSCCLHMILLDREIIKCN